MKVLRMKLLLSGMIAALVLQAQPAKKEKSAQKPKLVVGIVIDQMRWDFLYRYQAQYGENGFKRMLRDGFSCENTFIPYMPTYTAPGHTCVYTGSVPAIHGIVGNNWFSRKLNRSVYCTEDSSVNTVGSETNAGKMSPENMFTTTITDELRLSTNFSSKVIGIALKDRGAILPAGHSANAAYWYDDGPGRWISSTHYMTALPQWVNAFNDKNEPARYMSGEWNTLLPLAAYQQSTEDGAAWEGGIKGISGTRFPYALALISKGKFEAFKTTPFANTYTFDFAKAAIAAEELGKDAVTDFLTVSISSTDYIGHSFGPNSVEAQDTYLRLDRDIAAFLQYLDQTIGKDQYLVFLTADHGVAHVPAFLNAHKIPAGNFQDDDIQRALNAAIDSQFQMKKAVRSVQNYQVYLSDAVADKRDVLIPFIIRLLREYDFITNAVELDKMAVASLPEPQKIRMQNGYYPARSGDIQFVLKPGYFDGGKKGTTHGLWNPYDAHIPLLFFGTGIRSGKTNRETYMTDIAATVAALLQIQMPNGCVGKPIEEVRK